MLQKELIKQVTDAGLQPPEKFTIAITNACNLNCIHCLLNCNANNALFVPANVINSIVSEFGELGGKSIRITGGEPLLHPEWLEILRSACNQPGFAEVGMQTNAVLITEKHISGLLSLPKEKLSLQVSLDGATSATNDRVRGAGIFESVVKALKLLSSAGLGDCTKIAFTEMRDNFDELPDMLELVKKLGLKELISNTIVRSGRSLQYDWAALPASSQIKSLIKRYNTDPVFNETYEKFGNIAAIEWFKGRNDPAYQICNCISTPYISADGKLYPCTMYLKDTLAVKHAFEQSLEGSITEGLGKWAELPKIGKKRSSMLKECDKCSGRPHCKGGCPGRADAVYGNAMSVEDRCHLRKTVYSIVS